MGNCLDRTLSDSDEQIIVEDGGDLNNTSAMSTHHLDPSQRSNSATSQQNSSSSRRNRDSQQQQHHHHPHPHHSHHHRSSRGQSSSRSNQSSGATGRANRYLQTLIETRMSRTNDNTTSRSSANSSRHERPYPLNGSFVNTSYLPPASYTGTLSLNPAQISQQQQQQVYYLTPNVQRTADQLTEEEQIKLLKRMTLIQQLPSGSYDENKKNKECVICMIDFEVKDTIKYLPCMHTFHAACIDTWLLRSLICPSCMEPVDAGLLAAYE